MKRLILAVIPLGAFAAHTIGEIGRTGLILMVIVIRLGRKC